MRHCELVARAAKWLKLQKPLRVSSEATAYHIKSGCGVIVTETGPALGEQPDAIGFTSNNSYLIECKTSRADFIADSKKPWRLAPERGMGNYRFFMCVPGLIQADELPEGWGLLYCHERTTEIVKAPTRQDANDFPILYSLVRRAVCQGFNPSMRYREFLEVQKGAQP